MFQKIDQILNKELKSKNLANHAQSAYICTVAEKVLGGKYKIVSFRQGALTIGVKNNYEAMEIQNNIVDIIKKNNSILGQNKIIKIKYRIYKSL